MSTAESSPVPSGPGLLVTIDGMVVDRDRPVLRGDDLGVMRGDGIFEAFLVVDGRSDRLDDHLARLGRSASKTEMTVPTAAQWQVAIDAVVAAWTGASEMVVRLIVTRGVDHVDGHTAYLLADPLAPVLLSERLGGISVLTLERGLDPELATTAPWLLMGAKTLSYAVNMAAGRWVRAHDADDAVFVGPGGLVLEGPTSAVVAARGRCLVSPPPSLGILDSVSLKGLFEVAPAAGWEVAFERLTVEDLHAADAVWLLSSVRLASRVHTLDGKPLADNGLHAEVAAMVGPGGVSR